MRYSRRTFSAAAFVGLSTVLFAATPAELVARLKTAREMSRITDPALKPWHLSAEFDLLDKSGAVTEHGSIDKLWAGEDLQRLTIKSPSYTAVLTSADHHVYRTRGADALPELLDALLQQMQDPLPDDKEVEASQPKFESQKFGKVALDCTMLTPPHTFGFPPLGSDPTYCFNPGQTELRAFFNFGTQQVLRNQLGTFQGRSVALQITIIDGQMPVAKASISRLTGYTPVPADFVPSADQEEVSQVQTVGSAVLIAKLITKVVPEYPPLARQQHIHGRVLLRVVLGRDGHVKTIRPLRSPSPLLTESAIKAVRGWVYEPFLVDGRPMEVTSVVTVNFNMG